MPAPFAFVTTASLMSKTQSITHLADGILDG
jgi:hypothetical protein